MSNEEIQNEARALLNKFGKDLEEVKIDHKVVKSDKLLLREEGNVETGNVDFKTIMFKNAPRKDSECLLTEKGSWS